MHEQRLTNALFISDIHLTEDRPDCTRAFFRFLEWIPESTDALFILGDFFEYWVGDDISTQLADDVAKALEKVHLEKKIQLFFVAGNRDFSIGTDFCARSKMTLLPEQSIFDIANLRTHLSHGDQLCTDDVSYQRFRKIIRNPLVLKLLLALPRSKRTKIAEKLRARSKQRFKNNPVYIDVNLKAVDQLADSTSAEVIIHGHTHLADIHQVSPKAQRVVLGDWHKYGWYGQIDNSGARLHRFDIIQPVFD